MVENAKEVKISHEHSGFQWMSPEKAMKETRRYGNMAEVLQEAHDFVLEQENR